MNCVRQALADYLMVRRALGFKLDVDERLLPKFIAFMEQAGANTITTDLAYRWCRQPPQGSPNTWRSRLRAVRSFAKHLRALDPRTEIPAAGILPAPRRAIPYLYSDSDITALLEAAGGLPREQKATTYQTLIGLLATTGLRAGEALWLDRSAINWGDDLLTIESTKFGKGREVPLHPSALEALRAYDRQRLRWFPRLHTSVFFLSTTGTPIDKGEFNRTFHRLILQTGIGSTHRGHTPRPHDLRHTFAVCTLIDWYRAEVDVAARMPMLSTYLGHVDPKATYWYLSASPELFGLAAERLERALEEIS